MWKTVRLVSILRLIDRVINPNGLNVDRAMQNFPLVTFSTWVSGHSKVIEGGTTVQ